MTVPAKVKEADIMRALRAAKKVGAKRVIVGADGSIDIHFEDNGALGASAGTWEETPTSPTRYNKDGAIIMRKHARKRLEF